MFKRHLKLEVRGSENRLYELHVDETAPLGELYDAVHTMLAFVTKEINDSSMPEEASDESSECTSEECCESACEG
jgi:hypothetical protein